MWGVNEVSFVKHLTLCQWCSKRLINGRYYYCVCPQYWPWINESHFIFHKCFFISYEFGLINYSHMYSYLWSRGNLELLSFENVNVKKKSNKFTPSLLWAVTNAGVQQNLNSTPNKNINIHYLIKAISEIIRKVSSWESYNEMEGNSCVFYLPTGL